MRTFLFCLGMFLPLSMLVANESQLPDPLRNEPVTTVFEGDFYQYRLQLTGEGFPGEGIALLVATVGNDVVSVGAQHDRMPYDGDFWFNRDLRVHEASPDGFRIDVSFSVITNDVDPRSRQIALEVQRQGDRAQGTATYHTRAGNKGGRTWESYPGTVSGTVLSESAMQQAHAVAADQSWTSYAGTTSRFAATEGGAAIDPDLTQARLVWKSPEMGSTEIGSQRGIMMKLRRPHAEGGASPIVADGRVFQFRVIPAGSQVDARVEIWRQMHTTDTIERPSHLTDKGVWKDSWFNNNRMSSQLRQKLTRNFDEPGPLFPIITLDTDGPRNMALFADEQVMCLDAATGRPLWATTIPQAGLNAPNHKEALANHTGSYASGRFYAFSSLGVIYALNAETGALEWRAEVPSYAAAQRKSAEFALRHQRVSGFNRASNGALIAVDDLIIAPSGVKGGKLVTLNAADGSVRWEGGTIGKTVPTPTIWRHGGKTYALTNSSGQLVCIDLATGDTLWQQEGVFNEFHLAIHGDQLLAWSNTPADVADQINAHKGKEGMDERKAWEYQRFGSFGLYDLSLQGATLRWQSSNGAPTNRPIGLFSADGSKVGVRIGNALYAFDSQSGEQLAEHLMWHKGTPDESIQFSVGDVTYWLNDSQHGGGYNIGSMLLQDEVTFLPGKRLPGFYGTSTYGVGMISPIVDGRIFLRSQDGVYCYDLRASKIAK